MGHESVRGCAVPVLFTWFDVDDVPGADFLDAASAVGDVADAIGDVEGLAAGVGVPCGAGAGGEADVGASHGGLVVGVADAVDVDGAGEPVAGAGGGLTSAGSELHGDSFLSGSMCSARVQDASVAVTVAVMSPAIAARREVASPS